MLGSLCVSPFARFDFTTGKMTSEPISTDKKPCESCRLFIGHKSGGFCGRRKEGYIIQNGPVKFARIICAKCRAKIIEPNGLFGRPSRKRLLSTMLFDVRQRRRPQCCRLWRLHLSSTAVFTLAKTRSTNEETAQETVSTGANISPGVKTVKM